jgi:hypothetical protein
MLVWLSREAIKQEYTGGSQRAFGVFGINTYTGRRGS